MSYIREPTLEPVSIDQLHPTQITVGMREVEDKRKRLQARPPEKIGKFLGHHMIPVVTGPKKRQYIIDHHHLALALHYEGLEHVLVTVMADLSALELNSFWVVLDHHGWVHPYDANGQRQNFGDIPECVVSLQDDPFRSLAGELRRMGGFAKESTPFGEFLWADFLRQRIQRQSLEADFDSAVTQALQLAKSDEAEYLPGVERTPCGDIIDDCRLFDERRTTGRFSLPSRRLCDKIGRGHGAGTSGRRLSE